MALIASMFVESYNFGWTRVRLLAHGKENENMLDTAWNFGEFNFIYTANDFFIEVELRRFTWLNELLNH